VTALFARVLGDAAFSTLPLRVQALHRAQGKRVYLGEAQVQSGSGFLARLCAWATALPRAGSTVPVRVEITSGENSERWAREFGAQRMPSRFWSQDGLLCERIGLVTFGFALQADSGELIWHVRRVRALGIPLPAGWFRGVTARESEASGRYCFDVAARLPLAGLLVHYRGWLTVDTVQAA
jgi:hypothetical protein